MRKVLWRLSIVFVLGAVGCTGELEEPSENDQQELGGLSCDLSWFVEYFYDPNIQVAGRQSIPVGSVDECIGQWYANWPNVCHSLGHIPNARIWQCVDIVGSGYAAGCDFYLPGYSSYCD